MIILLLIIISLLVYIAFFTPEKIKQREISRAQEVFNAPLYPNAVEFSVDDVRNTSHPDEVVKIGPFYTTRGRALDKLAEARKEHPDADEEFIQTIARLRMPFGM